MLFDAGNIEKHKLGFKILQSTVLVHENLAIYSHNPEVRYIKFLLMDSGSELSPEQDPVVWKILNFGHLALNGAN